MRRAIGMFVGAAMLCAWMNGNVAAQAEKPETKTVTPVAEVDADNADWVLIASNALDGRAAVEIYLARREGQWKGAFALAPSWNHACHSVDTNELTWSDGRLTGRVTITFNSDGYVPAGGPLTAHWVLDARRHDGRAVSGTFTGKLGAKTTEGKFAGMISQSLKSMDGRRIRVRLVDPRKLSEILWCTVEDDKLAGGYLFQGGWDGKVDLSRVELRGCTLTGNVNAVSSDGKDAGAGFEIRASIVAGRVGGAFSRPGGTQSGVLAGTCVPLNESQVAPYNPTTGVATGAATAEATGRASKDLPERWEPFHIPAGVPDPPPGLVGVGVVSGDDRVADADKRYAVLLHNGVGGAAGRLRQAMKEGKVRPMIYCTVRLSGDGFDGSLDRILAYVDRYWPTIRDPQARLAMGFSAGAHHIFRYIDRSDLIGCFIFLGHPLQAAGWAHQRAAEREALIRGAEARKKWPVDVLLVAGTEEGGFKGIEPTRQVLEANGVKTKTIVIEGLRHTQDHFQSNGDEIWAWVESCMGPRVSDTNQPLKSPRPAATNTVTAQGPLTHVLNTRTGGTNED